MRKVFRAFHRKKSPPRPSQGAGDATTPSSSQEQFATVRRGSSGPAAASIIAKVRRKSSAASETFRPSGRTSKLHKAVISEDIEKVKKLVATNDLAIVNAVDANGRTALHIAAEKGIVSLVWPLVSHGASVLVKDHDQGTPLHLAVRAGHVEAANMLLDRGCHLNEADINGDSLLHLAVRAESMDILGVLLRKGANPDVTNKVGESPLLESIRLLNVPAARMLLRCGASVNQLGPNKVTPLMLAASHPDTASLVEMLLDHEADPVMQDANGWTAMNYAQDKGLSDIVDYIIDFVDTQRMREQEFSDYTIYDDVPPIGPSENDDTPPEDYGFPMEKPTGDIMTPSAKKLLKTSEPLLPERGVPISDISSWGSDSSLSDEDPARGASPAPGIKHSKGIIDLSKFLNSDVDENDEDLVEFQRTQSTPKSTKKASQPQRSESSPDKINENTEERHSLERKEESSLSDDWSLDDNDLLKSEDEGQAPNTGVLAPFDATHSIADAEPETEKQDEQRNLLNEELTAKFHEKGLGDGDKSASQTEKQDIVDQNFSASENSPSKPASQPSEKVGFAPKEENGDKDDLSVGADKKSAQDNDREELSTHIVENDDVIPDNKFRRKRKGSRSSRCQRSSLGKGKFSSSESDKELLEDNKTRRSSRVKTHKVKEGNESLNLINPSIKEASDDKSKPQSLRKAKENFLKKIQDVSSKEDQDSTGSPCTSSLINNMETVTSSGMLSSDILVMEKPDLLVHIQKLQLALEQAKSAASAKVQSAKDEKIAELQRDIGKFKEELVSTSIQLQHATNEVQQMKSKESEYSSVINEVRTELSQKEAKVNSLTKNMEDLRRLNEDLEAKWERAKHDIQEIKSRETADSTELINELKDDLSNKDAKLSSLTEDYAELKKINEELERNCEQAKKEVQEMKSKEEQVSSEICDLKNDLNQKDTEIDTLTGKVDQLKRQNAELESRCEQATIDRQKSEVQLVQDLQQRIRNSEKKVKELEEDKAAISKEMESLRQKHHQSLAEAKQFSDQVVSLTNDLKESVEKCEKLKAQNESHEKALESIQKEKESIERKAQDLEASEEEKLRSIKELEKEIEHLQNDKESKSKLSEVERSLEEFKNIAIMREENIKSLREELQTKENLIGDLTLEAKALRQEVFDLKEARKRQDNVGFALKDKLQKDKDDLAKQLEAQAAEISELEFRSKEELKALEERLEKVTKSKESAIAEKNRLEAEMKKLKSNHEIKVSDLSDELAQLQNAKRKLDQLTESLKKQLVGRQQEDFDRLESSNRHLQQDLDQALADRDMMFQEAKHWEAQAMNMDQRIAQENAKAAGEMEALKRDLSKMEGILQSKEAELMKVKNNLAFQKEEGFRERSEALQVKEQEVMEVNLQLQTAQQKITMLEDHIQHLQARITQLEDHLANSLKEKRALVVKLRKKEEEVDHLNINVVDLLKQQLKNEQHKLEMEQEKIEHLEAKRRNLMLDMDSMKKELNDMKSEMERSVEEKRRLKKEVMDLTDEACKLERNLESEKKAQVKSSQMIGTLETKLTSQQKKLSTSEKRIAELKSECEKELLERVKAEKALEQKQEELQQQVQTIESLNAKIARLQAENKKLCSELSDAVKKQKNLNSQIGQAKELTRVLEEREKMIEELEEELSKTKDTEAAKHEAEMKRYKLQVEILARNEVNQKLAEINDFLAKKAAAQAKNNESRDVILQKLQEDLGEKLHRSKKEVADIKKQMMGTVKSIKTLQTQLQTREQELAIERNLRRQLEKRLGPKEVEKLLKNDYARPTAYF